MEKAFMAIAVGIATLAMHSAGADANCVIRNTADLSQALEDEVKGANFDITGIVAFPFRPKISLLFDVMDETGTVLMYRNATNSPCNLSAGDRVRAVGVTRVEDDEPSCYALCSELEVLSRGTDLKYEESSAPDIVDGRHDNQLVRISGTVRDTFMDEIDPKWGFVVLQDGRETVYTCFPTIEPQNEWLNGLIGAKVSIKGLHQRALLRQHNAAAPSSRAMHNVLRMRFAVSFGTRTGKSLRRPAAHGGPTRPRHNRKRHGEAPHLGTRRRRMAWRQTSSANARKTHRAG